MHYVFPCSFWLPTFRAACRPLVYLALALALCLALGVRLPSAGEVQEGVEMVGALVSLFVMVRGRG